MKEQFSPLAKSAASNIFSYFVLIRATRVKDLSRAWDGNIGYCELCCWQLEIDADFWPDLVKNCFEGGDSILNKSTVWVEKNSMWRFIWRKREFYGVIWPSFARVKCGNIISQFSEVLWLPPKSFIVWFTEGVDRQISDMWLSSRYQKTLWQAWKRFASVEFRRFCLEKPILWSKIVDLNLVFSGSSFDWLKSYTFPTFQTRRLFHCKILLLLREKLSLS